MIKLRSSIISKIDIQDVIDIVEEYKKLSENVEVKDFNRNLSDIEWVQREVEKSLRRSYNDDSEYFDQLGAIESMVHDAYKQQQEMNDVIEEQRKTIDELKRINSEITDTVIEYLNDIIKHP